jgi:hypothetical protein
MDQASRAVRLVDRGQFKSIRKFPEPDMAFKLPLLRYIVEQGHDWRKDFLRYGLIGEREQHCLTYQLETGMSCLFVEAWVLGIHMHFTLSVVISRQSTVQDLLDQGSQFS